MAACLALASDAVACLPWDVCQGADSKGLEPDSAPQQPKGNALQGIMYAAALLAASAAELVSELGSDDPPEAGGVLSSNISS